MRMLRQEEESDDVEVSWEDQQRICTFSKLNTRLQSHQEKLKMLKQEKEGLDDLSMELELADEDEIILYRIGEAFMHIKASRALDRAARETGSISEQIEKVSDEIEECSEGMKKLKVVLYAKFGSAINLDE